MAASAPRTWSRPLEEVLEILPQKRPFRFVDALLRLDDQGAEGRYRFREDEVFYAGHFPGWPVTPGVILIEAMAQVAVVAHGIYLYALEYGRDDLAGMFTAFVDVQAEFLTVVRPGDEVRVVSEKVFFRHKKIRSRVEMRLADGRMAATATMSGIGVSREAT
jgi:3-hydroxyacyl-[acyl-carrier-protein] dehydratase